MFFLFFVYLYSIHNSHTRGIHPIGLFVRIANPAINPANAALIYDLESWRLKRLEQTIRNTKSESASAD
jgi:hypothetical protein